MTADEIIKLLKLEPHIVEGGYFLETYRSEFELNAQTLPPGFQGKRSLATAIYYCLAGDNFSELHRLVGDETFHFYLGDPVEMLQLYPDGSGNRLVMGQDIATGMMLQVTVPAGVWQGTRLLPGGKYALLGTTMSPGFDYCDYETGKREELLKQFPQFSKYINALTRFP